MNSKRLYLAIAIAALLWAPRALSQDAGNGGANAMGEMGAHMHMGPHMTMTSSRPMTPDDLKRAQEIIQTMREKLAKYQDYKAAEADGYEPFMPTVPQDVYHFANYAVTAGEYADNFDLAHPGSLLYVKKTFGGYRMVGAMYDAPPSAAPSELDERIPLSIGHWHAHTNICLPAGITENDVINGGIIPRRSVSSAFDPTGQRNAGNGERMRLGYMAAPRFGFQGTISERAECEAARGTFHPQIFGWMIHVYPFAGDDLKAAFGTDVP